MSKQKLGRGFDALIPTTLDKSIMEEDPSRVQKLLIDDILPNPDQPRREFDKSAHSEMVASIKQHGVLQPIIVTHGPKGYRIVAGERRWRAAKDAKLTHIPSIVRSLKELEEVELSLIENIQRVDLSPLEQALSVLKLQQQFNLALDQIAKKLGKAPSTLSNITRLLQLPESASEALRSRRITEGHARAILSLQGMPDKQAELLRCILDNKWTVRQAEQFAVAAKSGASADEAKKTTASENDMTRKLSTKLHAPVSLKRLAQGGQIVIRYKSDDDLGRIVNLLEK